MNPDHSDKFVHHPFRWYTREDHIFCLRRGMRKSPKTVIFGESPTFPPVVRNGE